MNIGLITKALNLGKENLYNTAVGGGLLTLGGLGVKPFQQRAADMEQIKNFLHQNLGAQLTQAQRDLIKYGSKVPNELARQAYGKGGWREWLNARTSAGHFGPVEGMKKWEGRLLGASGVPLLAYEMLGKEAGQDKWLGSDPAAGWQKEMIDPTFSGLPVGMKGGTHSSSDNTGDSSTPSNTRNVRPSGGNINTGGDDKIITTTSNVNTGGGGDDKPHPPEVGSGGEPAKSKPTITTSSYSGDPSGRTAKPREKSFSFEDTKSRASRTPTRSRTITPSLFSGGPPSVSSRQSSAQVRSRVRPGYGKPPTRPGGR